MTAANIHNSSRPNVLYLLSAPDNLCEKTPSGCHTQSTFCTNAAPNAVEDASENMAVSAFGRELLGMFAAVKYLRPQVEGRIFHIKTEHKPLTNVMSKKGVRDLNREKRQLQYISTFTTDIRHVSGKKYSGRCLKA